MDASDSKADKLLKQSSVLPQDILHYLEQQEQIFGENDFSAGSIGEDIFGTELAKEVLEDVIESIEKRFTLKKCYEKKLKQHNQYDLVNLKDIIRDYKLNDKISENLCFRESLVIGKFPHEYAPVPDPMGGLCLYVQLAKGAQPLKRYEPQLEQQLLEILMKRIKEDIDRKSSSSNSIDASLCSTENVMNYMEFLKNDIKSENAKFLVHISSQFDFDGKNGGSRVTAWVDQNLHTIEEKRIEYVKDGDDIVDEKYLYVGLLKKRYYVSHKDLKENVSDRKYYSLQKAKHYIGEGANVILMRYLAIARYVGEFELTTMYINGDMCRNIYVCQGPESGIINDTKLDVCKIQRIIIEEHGIVHRCSTVLTLQGQTVKQDWDDCHYILQLIPSVEVFNTKPRDYQKISLTKTWQEDMQLFSAYLDAKTEKSKFVKSYLLDHPEVKDMVADFMQQILAMKPHMIMDFATEYFSQFLPCTLPRNTFEDIGDSESFII